MLKPSSLQLQIQAFFVRIFVKPLIGIDYMLKDAVNGYVSIQTVCLSCGLISIGHGLSFTCFGRFLKGLLVFGVAKRITLPLELFTTTIELV